MRVIAGSLKGRRLAAPTWTGLRPTSDKLRETLFNIIGPRVADATVMDGFAGTGAIGIEAISRGAAHVTFVECDRRAADLVARNLRHCGLTSGYAIIRADIIEAIARETAAGPFSLILLDPPYDWIGFSPLLDAAGTVLSRGGLLVLEHAKRRSVPERSGRLVRTRDVICGDSALGLYEGE